MITRHAITLSTAFLCLCLGCCCPALAAYTVTTPLGQHLRFETVPRRVVSLYPSASEILAAIGKGDALAGVTLHDRMQPGLENTAILGGFANPDMQRVASLQPDLVIAAPMQEKIVEPLVAQGVAILYMDTLRLSDAPANIRCLGAVMHAPDVAEMLIRREEGFQRLAMEKLARTVGRKPAKVMRIMEILDDALLAPGDDSFQNELIAHAGGVPPRFGADGQAIRITPAQLRAFNPDIVYVGSLDPEWVRKRLSAPEWGASQAKVLVFPRDLLSRAASNYGLFSLWLSAELHADAFAKEANQVRQDMVLASKQFSLPFSYLAEAAVSEASVFDFPAKTLTLRFTSEQQILSSLDGWRSGITTVGNHYSSQPSWPVTHHIGLEASNARIMKLYGLDAKTAAFLYTGADMDKLAYAQAESDGMTVGALVTAGVSSNAMRASFDAGRYVEAGTINVILLTNRHLTPAAMTRAIITATEAKTAVFEDLDIRSSYSGKAATGTGTDNVLVIAGDGPRASLTGGHAKLGELIARATYQAVREAIKKQHNIVASRDIFQRLRERNITLPAKPHMLAPDIDISAQELAGKLERILLEPHYAGFMEAALALADSAERGLISDMRSFSDMSLGIASKLAGKKILSLREVFVDDTMPSIVRGALNALATGLCQQDK